MKPIIQFLEAQPPYTYNNHLCLSDYNNHLRLFQLASGEVSLTILTSTIVGEYRRVLSVALLSQAKQSECGTVHFLGLDSYRTLYDTPKKL